MNAKLIASAMMAAGLFSVTGAAQAWGPSSPLDDVGAIVALRAMDEIQVANIAVNTAEIDGSLRIETEKGDIRIVGNEGHLSTDIALEIEVETDGFRNDAESHIDVTVEPVLEAKLVGNNQFSTAAYGAVNAVTVEIDAAQTARVGAGGIELELELDAESGSRFSRMNRSFDVDLEASAALGFGESLNPTASALQVAYNNADIDASITLEAGASHFSSSDIGIANTDMSSTAFGALNQATVAIRVAPAVLPDINLGN